MSDEKQLPKRFAETIGDDYDLFKLGCPYHDEFQLETIKQINNHFDSNKQLNILEIGFGTGITSLEILEQTNSNLVGIDNEPKMLEKAINYIKKYEVRCELLIDDALDFLNKQKENSFDVVVNVWVLHNIPKQIRQEILKEIYRVLKPNGLFLNGDKIASDDSDLHQAQLELQFKMFEEFEKIGREDLELEWTSHYHEDDKPDKKIIQTDFIDFLTNIGFTKINPIKRYNLDLILTAIK
jgi:tRNA (cmo5U34)-methyltransferase